MAAQNQPEDAELVEISTQPKKKSFFSHPAVIYPLTFTSAYLLSAPFRGVTDPHATGFLPNISTTGTLMDKLSGLAGQDSPLGIGMGIGAILGSMNKKTQYALWGVALANVPHMRSLIYDANYAVGHYGFDTLLESGAVVGLGYYLIGKGLRNFLQSKQM